MNMGRNYLLEHGQLNLWWFPPPATFHELLLPICEEMLMGSHLVHIITVTPVISCVEQPCRVQTLLFHKTCHALPLKILSVPLPGLFPEPWSQGVLI